MTSDIVTTLSFFGGLGRSVGMLTFLYYINSEANKYLAKNPENYNVYMMTTGIKLFFSGTVSMFTGILVKSIIHSK